MDNDKEKQLPNNLANLLSCVIKYVEDTEIKLNKNREVGNNNEN